MTPKIVDDKVYNIFSILSADKEGYVLAHFKPNQISMNPNQYYESN